jgi:hypothetical protein
MVCGFSIGEILYTRYIYMYKFYLRKRDYIDETRLLAAALPGISDHGM